MDIRTKLHGNEVTDVNDLSDEHRTLAFNNTTWLNRQAGGCLEIGQWEDEQQPQDLIHICDVEEWQRLILAMVKLAEKVPVRY